MSEQKPPVSPSIAQLGNRIARIIAHDETLISVLAATCAHLREVDHSGVSDLEHAIKTFRIGIMRQRAVLGAAGIIV